MKMEGQMPATSISKRFQGGGWEGKEETESLRKSRAVDGLEDLVKEQPWWRQLTQTDMELCSEYNA